MTEFWESKYKTCRAAFLEMGRIYNREKKERGKNMQRIAQVCQDALRNPETPRVSAEGFSKILWLLGVK